jgi:hypothetical protein
MIPLAALGWGVAAALSSIGGFVYWNKSKQKLANGDTAYVPAAAAQLAVPGGVPISIPSLASLGLVKVENVTRGPSTTVAGGVPMATGMAGKEIGIQVALKFPVSAIETIERAGQKFPNPEKK